MDKQQIIANLRLIREHTMCSRTHQRLDILAKNIAPDTPAAYECDIIGYETVLSYMSKHEPAMLELTEDPVHNTVIDGKRLSHLSRIRQVPVLKVAACAHIKTRYPKVTHVNAYPTALLAEYFAA